MAKLKERELKILSALSQLTEPTRPTEVGQLIGEIPLNTGRALTELEKGGLAVQTDEQQNLWAVTDTGRDYLEEQKQLTVSQESATGTVQKAQQEVTVPSQADLFRAEGQRLGFGSRKGDLKLDAVVTYVERIANLDDLSSVWNAMTEMGVAKDVKKRWIKLYAQNLPGKEIPDELKEKMEGGEQAEKVAEAGKTPPLPNRFNVINGEIYPDPEGEYNWAHALQLVAQQKGTSPMEEILALREAGVFGKEGGSLSELADALLKVKELTGTDEETKQLLAGIYKSLKEGGEGKGESEDVKALREEVRALRDDLQEKERERLKEQISGLDTALKEVRAEFVKARSDARATDEYGIMSDAIKVVDRRLGAIEGTVRGVLLRPPRSLPPGAKKELTEAISEEAVEGEALDRLAREVLYPKPSEELTEAISKEAVEAHKEVLYKKPGELKPGDLYSARA